MRLIDADHFLAFVKAELEQDRPDNMHIHNIVRVLEDLPAAYNPDRVIEQIKNLKPYKLDLADALMDTLENGKYRHFICLEEAVNIVERGGIE